MPEEEQEKRRTIVSVFLQLADALLVSLFGRISVDVSAEGRLRNVLCGLLYPEFQSREAVRNKRQIHNAGKKIYFCA